MPTVSLNRKGVAMNKPLFALADEFLALARLLADDQDTPNEVIDEILDSHSGALETKAWNVAAMILQFEGEAEMVRTVEKRMTARRKSLESRSEWMRGYLPRLICSHEIFLSGAELSVSLR